MQDPSTATMMSPIGELVLTACDEGLLEVRLPASGSPLPRAAARGSDVMTGPGNDVMTGPGNDVATELGAAGVPSNPAPIGDVEPAFVSPPQEPRLSADAVLAAARRQLTEYFAGRRRTFVLPLSVAGTEFERRVWEALSGVAYGATVTYGQLARSIGKPGAARAVGAALGRNPLAVVVPCHRVVATGGGLGGFAGGLARKRLLLEGESTVTAVRTRT
jgi:methylated-DNA-[protein]-cysteine S-methyltransferase